MSLIASFLAALIFSSLLFCQFCFYPATHLAASPFTSAFASASTCHCLYLCYNLSPLLFGCPKQCLCPLLLLFWLLKFFSLLFLQFCFHPATPLAASTSTFASTSPSACHCHFLCHNYYLVVINSVCVFYCSFSGCFNLFFLFFLQFCFFCIVDILCALCTLFLLSSTVCLSSPFLFIHFHNLFSLYLAFLKTFLAGLFWCCSVCQLLGFSGIGRFLWESVFKVKLSEVIRTWLPCVSTS